MKRRLRIAYVIGSLNRGGLEGLYLDLFRSAQDCPFEMICIHRKDGSYLEDFRKTSVKMIHIPSHGLKDMNYLRQLRKCLIEELVDIIHVQMSEDVLRTRLAMVGHQLPIVLTTHAFDYGVNRLTRMIIWLSFRMTNKNLFVSDYQRQYFAKQYGIETAQQRVVYNCINTDKLDANTALESALPMMYVDGVKMVMVGNFVRGRDQYALMPVLKQLHDKGVRFDFYFAGFRDASAPERYDACVQYAKDNGLNEVHFLGGRGDVPALLREMDAFVYSTEHDTFGIAVLEAIAAGLPTFVNDWQVMTEITRGGELATIYKTRDTNDLMTKIAHFIAQPELYTSIAKKNAIEARCIYGVKAFAEQLNNIYEAI